MKDLTQQPDKLSAVDTPRVAVIVVGGIVLFFIVEFFLRPRIDRRKEAIAARRELRSHLLNIALAATMCAQDLPASARELKEEKDRQSRRMAEQAQTLYDNSGKYLVTYAGPIQRLLMRALFSIHAIALSRRRLNVRAERILAVVRLVVQIVEPPAPWAVWRFRNLISAPSKLNQTLDALEQEEVPRIR